MCVCVHACVCVGGGLGEVGKLVCVQGDWSEFGVVICRLGWFRCVGANMAGRRNKMLLNLYFKY